MNKLIDTDGFTILKGNTPDPYVDVLIKFPSNMAVGFIDSDNVWSVYSGGGWYTEVAKNDEQPIAWRALNQESMDAQKKMIVITTMDALPDYCYGCPCHDGDNGVCEADKEKRTTYERPYWCPLKVKAVKWNE